MTKRIFFALFVFLSVNACSGKQQSDDFSVVAYYSGDAKQINDYRVGQLTHIIFSFLHLEGNRLSIDSKADEETIRHLVSLKQQNPELKVMVALGGWGGCETCSTVFSTEKGREEFAKSTVEIFKLFELDGLDLDWEYPTVEGYPGHPYGTQDKPNFTALVKTLRQHFGHRYELSFAAGGYTEFLEEAVDWLAIMPLMDRVNLMSYDLVNGYSRTTGHHTGLFSSENQKESTDHGVEFLLDLGVEPSKIVIGAAFYARVWQGVTPIGNGLFQEGTFKQSVNYHEYPEYFSKENGFELFRDEKSQADYFYSKKLQEFGTFDSKQSVADKVGYAKQNGLGGIMFWQLTGDTQSDGLLEAIDKAK
ncbi:glycoside hydrolase family 18 protein [Alteromonadaceae bacterium M269]|nr:glycoside hydrolase family 18 protein [Alteromonadaceae bacterium M269]